MAESIAKLAVVITGDAGPLAREMNRAGQIVQGADRRVMSIGKSLSALKGNWAAAFSIGGGGALAITAMVAAVRQLANAGDTLLQKIGADKLETWAGQWERVNEQLGIMGLRFTTIARDASSGLADTLGSINQALFPDAVAQVNAIKAREAAEKRSEEARKKQEEANKRQLKLNKEAAEAQQKERDAMLDAKNAIRDRAEEIRESVETPAETLKRTFIELRSLMAGGFLDEATAMRAAENAKRRFDDATKRPRSKAEDIGAGGAADRYTMAGFNALHDALREQKRAEELEQEQLEEAKKQTETQKTIAEILRNQAPITIMEGAPP